MTTYATCTVDCPVDCDGRCRDDGSGRAEAVPEPSFLDRLRAQLVDSAGLDGIPEPEPLIAGVLQLDSLAWLIGPPGNGKSFLALDMAGSVGTGEPWQGYQATPGPVLYLVAEGVSGIRPRVRAWEASSGAKMTGVQFLPVAVQASSDGEWGALVDLAAELRPSLIVLDTQARVTTGMDENAAKDMGIFVHKIERLRKATGACVCVVHHQGRNGDHMRGSTALEGAATTIIKVAKSDDILTISCSKQKDAEEFDDFRLRMVSSESSAVLMLTDAQADSGAQLANRKWVREWWLIHEQEPVSVSVLVKSGVVSESTFHRSKLALMREGVVNREGEGNSTRYRLAANPTPG
jgi:hypothetical protein